MAISEQQVSEEFHEEEDYSENGDSDDSEEDPTYDILEKTQSCFSKLSIKKKSKARYFSTRSPKEMDFDLRSEADPDVVEMIVPEADEKDDNSFEKVQKIIEAGQLEKLKVDQCKVYLRKFGLRLTGNKDTLIGRIREHLDITTGGGEKKYPISSFVLNCKGDACTRDVVMFEQNVYETFNIASRSSSGPLCGTRIVAGRIVKESYGAAKQQHTFTIEVLWSKGEKPLPPLHPLLIKGRNLYRLKTLRQRWEDEGERRKVLMEKHSRGSLARSNRESRIQEKEMRKRLKENRKEEHNREQSQLNSRKSGLSIDKEKPRTQPQQSQPKSTEPAVSTFQYHPNLTEYWNSDSCKENKGVPHNSIKFWSSSNSENLCRLPKGDEFLANYGRPNFCWNDHRSMINSYPNANGLSERTHYRQPLTSMNHYSSMNPSQRRGHTQQQPCKYYAQGRCHFGDNCKFSH